MMTILQVQGVIDRFINITELDLDVRYLFAGMFRFNSKIFLKPNDILLIGSIFIKNRSITHLKLSMK